MKKRNIIVLLVLLLVACAPLQTITPVISIETVTPTPILTSTPTLAPPPFTKEVLDSFGEIYYYEEGLGLVYKNADGTERLVMKLNDARTAWVDDESYTEFSLDAYKPILVNGVEPDGRLVKIIHTRVVGEGTAKHTEIYLPKTGEWRSTVGYEPGLTTEEDKTKWNVVTIEDVTSGFLREIKLAQQYKWEENSIIPNWYVAFIGGSRTGSIELTQSGNGWEEYKDQVFPMAPVDMYWIKSPNDSNKLIGLGVSQNKGPNGEDIVLVSAFGDEQINGYLEAYLSKDNANLSYLIAVDSRDCTEAKLIGNTSNTLINEACVFWQKDDPRWNLAGWDVNLEGGTVEVSKPLSTEFVAQYQDNVMISLIGY